MAIPISSSLIQLNAESFLQEGFELSLDAIIPSITLTGSFSTATSKTQLYIYNYAKTVLYENLNYQANGSYLTTENVNSNTNSSSSYNQFELNPVEDVYNQGYSSGKYYTVYNFINYELGSELIAISLDQPAGDFDNNVFSENQYDGHPYYLKEISGDRTEVRIANNFLTSQQIETYYNQFTAKLNALENADEFYLSFGNNRNFIGVNSLLETSATEGNSILIKLYKPLPSEFQLEEQLQIITKAGETQAFEIEFSPDLEFIDNLLQLKGPNYNVDIKDRVNNSTNFKSLNDLINTNSSQSYYQFSQLKNQKGIILRKNWGDWSQFVKYSSAEQRLNNFYDKLSSIESSSAELAALETITNSTTASADYSSSYNSITNDINQVISKFDSYEYFLYYVTGSESWPKYTDTYPYTNYSVTSSAAINWFGSTDEGSAYFSTGKNQINSASRYDNDNQDYLYYLIPPFITENSNNNQYIKFVNMTGQAFDEMYLYTEAVEQVRNTNSQLTGSVLPLGLADDVIESLGFDTYANDFNSGGFNVNGVGVFPASGSGLEYIDRYIDIASGSVINYYDQHQSTLGYVIALADPSFPYPIENAAQEIYRRIFHNMISLVKRKGTVTGLRQLINIWGVPNTMLRISEFGGKNKDDENDYDLWMNRYSTAFNSFPTPITSSIPQTFYPANANAMFPWLPLAGNYLETAATPDVAVPDCIQFRFKTARDVSGTTNFSESVLLKRGQNGFGGSSKELNNGDFGIYLHQSGSNSGSYDGAIDPHYNTYASMSFVISGSIDEGAGYYRDIAGTFYANCYVTDPIYLPFYNKGWWTVQIQRMTHLSASNEDNTLNEYELKVGQNIYDGYDGNQIGWLASSSLRMIDGKVSQSMNEAWNRFYIDDGPGDLYDIHNYLDSQVYLPGNIVHHSAYRAPNTVGKKNTYLIPGFNLGDTMSGSFQEFRYYRRALSSSAFLDLVMNPESIQGHSDSNYGPGSSYDLLSYRVPLGNELEFNNPNGAAAYMDASGWVPNIRQFAFGQLIPTSENAGSSGGESVGSVHPSAINYDTGRSLYTGSFFMSNFPFGINASQAIQPYFLNFRFNSNPNLNITSSYIVPNTEINYMDQPSAGIRNRIKNKIQVIDGNEYGTILSPFRSIQQEFEQSASYTEDLNSLEVGFSFQNEINDDIISTFGHGVVSDVIADPRMISESGDRYPELTRIAEEYFNKYQGYTINTPLFDPGNVTAPPHLIEREFDYNRLIKFYESSLFKAIKSYVPARTSLSTGIIVKQHLLERNRTDIATGINIDGVIAKTPETGSENGLNQPYHSNNSRIFTPEESGFNSPIQQENLLITSSIEMATITGSTGGSVEDYNNLLINSLNFDRTLPNLGFQENFSSGLPTILKTGSFAPINLFVNDNMTNVVSHHMNIFGGIDEGKSGEDGFLATDAAFEGNFFIEMNYNSGTLPDDIMFTLFSDKRGAISEFVQTVGALGAQTQKVVSPFINIYPNERIKLLANVKTGPSITLQNMTLIFGRSTNAGYQTVNTLQATASQQVNWYVDNYTGDWKVDDFQAEFYDGEYSGSNFEVIPPQYNPYRIFADGNNQTPDTLPEPYVDFTKGGNISASGTSQTLFQALSANTLFIDNPPGPATSTYQWWTGSFFNLVEGEDYEMSFTLTGNQFSATTLFIGFNTDVSVNNFPLQIASPQLTAGTPATATFSPVQSEATFADSTGKNNWWTFTPGVGVADTGKKYFTYNPSANAPFNDEANNAIGFFYATTPFPSVTITVNYIRRVESLAPKHFYPRDAFTIVPSQSLLFQNSIYNPIINNVSGSRGNSFLYDMDFDPVVSGSPLIEGIPNDYSLTVSASQLGWDGTPSTADDLLEFAEVPDSYYTTKAIINGRYDGTLLESADYNFYTGIPSESLAIGRSATSGIIGLANPPFLLTKHKVLYINGETGSWRGDISYGKNAVIDRNPIFFAHFKSSLESKEYYGTTTFNIDQLIAIPFEEILSEQSPIITSSLINGSNENLIPVSSTFVPGRKAAVIYNQSTKTFNNVGGTILNYNNLGVGSKEVNAGAINFVLNHSNEVSLGNTSTVQEYYLPNWYNYPIAKEATVYASLVTVNNSNIEATSLSQSILLSGSYFGFGRDYTAFRGSAGYNNALLSTNNISNISASSLGSYPGNNEFYTEAGQPVLAFTGSLKNENGVEQGILHLRGPCTGPLPGMVFKGTNPGSLTQALPVNGPSLMLFNSWNKLLNFGDVYPTRSLSSSFEQVPRGEANHGATISIGIKANDGYAPTPIIPSSNEIQSPYGYIGNVGSKRGALPVLDEFEKESEENYYRINVSASNLSEYRITDNQRLMIEPGDEIRVSYAYVVDPNTPGVVGKRYQDFTVLGYNQMPTNIFTSNFDTANNPTGSTTLQFDICSTFADPSIFLQFMQRAGNSGSLPAEGYNSFGELWKKYRSAMHNNVVFNLTCEGYNGNISSASGSITSLNTKSVVDSTGFIGVTMSLFDNNEIQTDISFNNGGPDLTGNFSLSTNYLINLSASFGADANTQQSGKPNPMLGTASINPIVISQQTSQTQFATFGVVDPGYLFDRIVVTPDPTKLKNPIPHGKIYGMTVRKRVEADDRVVLNVNQPSGSKGVQTVSGDGYLIPDDLTDIQQRNVQKIINKLKSENVFTQDSPDSQGS